MPITYDTLKAAIHHALGGDPDPGTSYARIINGAGRAWTTARDWYYLGNREATLTATSGSEWLALPSDYMSFVSLIPDGDSYVAVDLISPQEFLELRELNPAGSVAAWIGTIMHRTVSGAMAPWLRLYPAPTTAAAFTLLYNATWGEVNEDSDTIPIPSFAEHAFEEWVRTYALGLEEGDSAPLATRLAALEQSPLMLNAARMDALATGPIVQPGRGAAQEKTWRYVRMNHPNNIS